MSEAKDTPSTQRTVRLLGADIDKVVFFGSAALLLPFIFFGVLVWRDAEILLEMENLSKLRYRGNISPDLEFGYLMSKFDRDDQSEMFELIKQYNILPR